MEIDVVKVINEFKTQLAYSKNIGFFFGAGTSCSLGIPDISSLTKQIGELLIDEKKTNFENIKKDLEDQSSGSYVSIEDILNQLRRIRELTGETDKEYRGTSGKLAKELDIEICKHIYKIITEKEREANLSSTKKFFGWLALLNRNYSKEVFTTNYDLIIEKSFEECRIPYFDGFVGSYEPFFWQESIEKIVSPSDLTQNWIRLWKIHGSLSWFWKKDVSTSSNKIIRLGKINKDTDLDNEIVIYPSKEKYDSSRKQPFIAYFDRLKKYLLNGELLFIFTGYSFSDQHINEIILNCLRQNNRLSILVFFYKDSEVENQFETLSSYLNLIVLGPTKAIVNGTLGSFMSDPIDISNPKEKTQMYWDEENKQFKLGDFKALVEFLVSISGKKEIIEASL